ncbi:hypothetical protein [Bacillus velezensis]|uniref:hypothetical protein n=1 Tax=Bacillus velezensis TaxID=492670 RepID=UPI002107B62B|nr:hypothetical protein [Bacillus velezensis]UTY64744.1 hypothetical protein NN913_10555 [Bacillus velezensis]
MAWITNPWIVSLITAIVSTFIVNSLTKFFGRKDYIKRVNRANNQIINTLKDFISEGENPSLPLLESLSAANAKSNKVKQHSLYSIDDILDLLIKDISETNFLSIDQKIEISNNLLDLKRDIKTKQDEELEFKPIITDKGIITFDKGIKQIKEMDKIKRNMTTTSLIYIACLISYMTIMKYPKLSGFFQNNLSMIKDISIAIVVIVLISFMIKFGYSKTLKK